MSLFFPKELTPNPFPKWQKKNPWIVDQRQQIYRLHINVDSFKMVKSNLRPGPVSCNQQIKNMKIVKQIKLQFGVENLLWDIHSFQLAKEGSAVAQW